MNSTTGEWSPSTDVPRNISLIVSWLYSQLEREWVCVWLKPGDCLYKDSQEKEGDCLSFSVAVWVQGRPERECQGLLLTVSHDNSCPLPAKIWAGDARKLWGDNRTPRVRVSLLGMQTTMSTGNCLLLSHEKGLSVSGKSQDSVNKRKQCWKVKWKRILDVELRATAGFLSNVP